MNRLLVPLLAFCLAAPVAQAAELAPDLLFPQISDNWSEAAASVAAAADIVVEPRPGQYYLFHVPAAEKGKARQTAVRFSTDRANFGLKDANGAAQHLITTLPYVVTAVAEREGRWQVTALKPGNDQARTAVLSWKPVAPITAREKSRKPIRVALFDDYGSFGKGVPRVTELLRGTEEIAVTTVKPPLIQSGGLKDFDVVIFTGGSGSKQANTLGLLGREQVRRFIEAGGGYVGICAGNYLACDGFSWGLKVLDAKTKSSKWARGVGDVKIEFTEKGRQLLGMPEGVMDIRYANGPVFDPAGAREIGDFEPLAYFRSELAKNGVPVGAQVNSPAMVIGQYGQGRVLCSSPHPEQQPGMESFVERAVRWAAGG